MKEIIIAIVSAFAGGLINFIFERLKDRKDNKREKIKQMEQEKKDRPEYKIIEMRDYFDKPGININEKTCDMEVFLLPIERVDVNEYEVIARYNKDMIDREQWVCREYILKNIGNTIIYETHIISAAKRNLCVFDIDSITNDFLELGCLNYSVLHDNRIDIGQSVSIKLCFNKEKIPSNFFSAFLEIGIVDDNSNCWLQPFFAPDDKIYKSRNVSSKDYHDEIRPNLAIECFKKPYLW